MVYTKYQWLQQSNIVMNNSITICTYAPIPPFCIIEPIRPPKAPERALCWGCKKEESCDEAPSFLTFSDEGPGRERKDEGLEGGGFKEDMRKGGT